VCGSWKSASSSLGFESTRSSSSRTLTNARRYTSANIATLYHKRWLAELDIRAIKISLGMDVLRCKSPEMIRREVAACLLAYNLIRHTMLQSAQAAGVSPRQQSFTAALQKIAAGFVILAVLDLPELGDAHRTHLATHRVGHRGDRIEPRRVKRRPKPHQLLTTPRDEARAALLAGRSS
jgi:hypothetical protein